MTDQAKPARRRAVFRKALPFRMRAYFDANPTEELTVADAAAKFGAKASAVRMAVSREATLEHAHVIRRKDRK